MPSAVQGRHVLIVEDNAVVAIDLEMLLRDAGAEVVGPIDRIAEAMDHAESGKVEAAILDIEIGGEMVFPVADALRSRNVPIILASGHGPEVEIPEPYRDLPRISKPFDAEALVSTLDRILQDAAPRVA